MKLLTLLTILLPLISLILITAATQINAQILPVQNLMNIIGKQYTRAYDNFIHNNTSGQVPYYGKPESSTWELESPASPFTGGFFGGIFWFLYQNSVSNGAPNQQWLEYAWSASAGVAAVAGNRDTHDVGFPLLATFRTGYELTKNDSYLAILFEGAQSLASRYSPIVGCTRSWNSDEGFLVIIDNMMNIELLFWAGQFFNNATWSEMAFNHTQRTMEEHFRVDNSTWHVIVYNETDGSVTRKETNQGYRDWSTWTRGQAWSIHGFGQAYGYASYQPFLDKAIGAAHLFLDRLHKEVNDNVPYWDFDAPWTNNGQTPPIRDTSAGAIAASGLFYLSKYTEPQGPDNYFFKEAVSIISNLSTSVYNIWDHSEYQLPGLLTQAVGSLPANYEVSVAQTYGEFYFTEAIQRYSQIVSEWTDAGIVSKEYQENEFATFLNNMQQNTPKVAQL